MTQTRKAERQVRAALHATGTLGLGHVPHELGSRRQHLLSVDRNGAAQRCTDGVFHFAHVRCDCGYQFQRQVGANGQRELAVGRSGRSSRGCPGYRFDPSRARSRPGRR
jgi:hypothetical protein